MEEEGVGAGKEDVNDEEGDEDEDDGRAEGDSALAESPLDVLWKKS